MASPVNKHSGVNWDPAKRKAARKGRERGLGKVENKKKAKKTKVRSELNPGG
jgi:hypothetical protein